MDNLTMRSNKIHLTAILILLLSAACSSKPGSVPLPSPTALMTSTSTPIPPTSTAVPPTLTPTATPVPSPKDVLIAASKDFLLSAEDPDKQEMFNYPLYIEELDLNGTHSYYIRWRMVGSGNSLELFEAITISQEPWGKIPATNLPGSERFDAIPMVGDYPVVGESSQSFESDDKSIVGFVFIKGNTLVTIYARSFTLDDVASLGRLIEARLPEGFQALPPISFPDQLDQPTFDQYFKEVFIGTLNKDGGVDPLTVFPSPGLILWDLVENPNAAWVIDRNIDTPAWETAIYDLQTNRYIFKNTAIWTSIAGFKSACGSCPFQPGQYEFKLAMKGVLVASIPFEILEP
jgi:hypothetical protein